MKPDSPLRLLAAVAAALALLLGTACSQPGAFAARVNGDEISARDFLRELELLRANPALAEALGLGSAPPGTVTAELTTAWLTRMIQDLLVEQEAERRDIEPTAEQMEEAERLAVERFNGPEAWDGFPEWFQRRLAERVALVLSLETAVAGRPGEDELRAEFRRTREELGELACVSHILVDSRQAADEIRAQLAPERPFDEVLPDFARAAQALSTDTGSGQQGGDLGCQPRNSYVEPFEEFVWGGEVRRLSEPVESQFGFHLILVRSRGPARFEDVRDEIANRLQEQSAQEFSAVMSEVVDGSDIDVNPKFGSYEPDSLTGYLVTGPPAPNPPDGPAAEDEGGEQDVVVEDGTGGGAPPAPAP